jgi:hypothetical protein
VPNREHSKPLKMATAALSKIIGVRAAAKVAGVDFRTVERWVKGAQDGDEAEWTAARELAQARHLEALIRGDTRGATQWATSAGISARNQRYARLIAARDQRRTEQEKPPEPKVKPQYLIEFDASSQEVQRVFVAEFDAALAGAALRESQEGKKAEDGDADEAQLQELLLSMVRELAALSPEELEERHAKALREEKEYNDALVPPTPPKVAPDPIQVPPTPPEASWRVPEPPKPVNPGLHVLTEEELAEMDDQRHLWRRVEPW